jgi:hypothetical protein
MIPPGYITLPEALDIIESCVDDDDLHVLQAPPVESKRRLRWAAVHGLAEALSEHFGGIYAYVMRGGKPCTVSTNDMRQLIENAWWAWIESGRVDFEAVRRLHEDWDEPPDDPITEYYHGSQLLVHEHSVKMHWEPQARPEPTKTGAPGRPSSMDLVITEFLARLRRGETATSRKEEADALAQWLAVKHPNMPACSAKTIRNKLPPSFQPRAKRAPKALARNYR